MKKFFIILLVSFAPMFVSAASLSIQSLSPSDTVSANTPVYFSTLASGFSGPVTYSLLDSVISSTIRQTNINSSGNFSWIATPNDVGSHTITVTATDSYGTTASASQGITVNAPVTLSITNLSPGPDVYSGQTVTFSLTQTGFTNPQYTMTDTFGGGSINYPNLDSSGNFNWTPQVRDLGAHTLLFRATDSLGHLANTSITLTVNARGGVGITLGTVPTTVFVGTPVVFTASSFGFVSSTTYAVSDSFASSTVVSTTIDSSKGVFSWTPQTSDVGLHTLTVSVMDMFGYNASISKNILVTTGTTQTTNQTNLSSESNQTSSQTKYVFTRALTIGSRGADVTALQQILRRLGYLNTSPTGYFGSLTFAGVKQFQKTHGVSQVGNVGPATRAALNSL